MSRLSTCVSLLVLIPALAIFTVAQEKPRAFPDSQTSPPADAEEAKDKQAFELLETITEGISGLRSADNRIYLASNSADLLWDKDEKRARSLFDAVTKEIVDAISALESGDQEFHQRANAAGMIHQQRREILDRMARRDPEMAMNFLRATRVPTDAHWNQQTIEPELELHLANMIAAKDPARALSIAQAALRKRISYGVVQVLSQLDANDPAGAQALHRELVDRLMAEDLQRNHEFANVAWNLLNAYQPPQAKEETYRDLLELLTSIVLSAKPREGNINNTAHNYYHYAESLIPHLEKYLPGRVVTLRQWRDTVRRTLDPSSQLNQEMNDIAQTGTPDAILALANRYPAELQPQIYERAAWKAMTDGDPNRARQIINEFINNPDQRRTLLEQIEHQSVWNRVSQNKVAEAREMLARVKNVEQRVHMLASMAMNASHAGDKTQALELLDEAKALLDSQPTDANKMTIRLQLANNYSLLNAERSAALLEPIIVKLNEMVAAAVVLDGVDQRYLKDGEWTKAQYSTLGNIVNLLHQSLTHLARVDLETARRLSNLLERIEIRLVAQLEIVKGLVSSLPAGRRQPAGHVINSRPFRIIFN